MRAVSLFLLFLHYKIKQTMTDLKETLTLQTQDLKAEFIVNTKIWAAREFQNIERISKEYNTGVITLRANKERYYSVQKMLHNKGYRIISNGMDNFIAKEVLNAEKHYEETILKLVFRLEKEGINTNEDLQIISGRVDLNFETTIKHSKGITRAFTIIASGAVQKPHYRYLIKTKKKGV